MRGHRVPAAIEQPFLNLTCNLDLGVYLNPEFVAVFTLILHRTLTRVSESTNTLFEYLKV
jgi:hypothetical protein